MSLLSMHGITMRFPLENGEILRALTDVSLSIDPNEIVGLVGESGCGKTTLGRIACALTRPTAGTVVLNGAPLNKLSGRALRRIRPDIQMVFQNPYASLDPRMTVEDTLAEELLKKTIKPGSRIKVGVKKGKINFLLGKKEENASPPKKGD